MPTATKEKAFKISQISENARTVMARVHLHRDEDGKVCETPEEAIQRVALCIAGAEVSPAARKKYERLFFEMMADLKFLPNTPTLSNAGLPNGQLSACFVLPIEDSMEGIFDTIRSAALVHKSGGGTGFAFDSIRETGARVRSTNGTASGPLSYMRVFDEQTETIKQAGTRRGANMGCMLVDHPDIEQLITYKDQADECPKCKTRPPLSNFNISVKITDEFMQALAGGSEEFGLRSRVNGKIVRIVNPATLFDLIAHQAWKNGEPGVLFIDAINRQNPTPGLGQISATNPCGEQPLLPYEACVLGSINLVEHITDGEFNFAMLEETVRLATRFLDNVVEVGRFPLSEITEAVKRNRKIGLGVMGFADMLVKLMIPYGSKQSLELAEAIQERIKTVAYETSLDLADEKGTFPAVEDSIYARDKHKPRNAARTTIAPTGTISRVVEVSSGIEPLFALAYIKQLSDGPELVFYNQDLLDRLQTLRADGRISDRNYGTILERVKKTGSIQEFEIIPQEIRDVFRISTEIPWQEHLAMQAAFQKHLENAASKTIIFPNDATVDDIKNAYLTAYNLGLKGVTVYRNGSREKEAMSIGTAPREGTPQMAAEILKVRKRGDRMVGVTRKLKTGCGNIYVTLNSDEYGVAEVFVNLGKSGGCAQAQMQAIGKIASVAMRAGVGAVEIAEMLKGIRCSTTAFCEHGTVTSCADAIAKIITLEINGDVPTVEEQAESVHIAVANGYAPCPECGSPMAEESGCATCYSCGYSRCG